tara:strand:- start:3869 stop:4678 length:810 start_codon:yes stop_codon:yes gene_type:complete
MLNIKNLTPIQLNNLIRLGRDNDGGYIIPKSLVDNCDGLLSYGINKDWSFEDDFIKRKKNINVHCYDHTLNISSLTKFTIKSILLVFLYSIIFDRKRLKKSFDGLFIINSYFNFFNKKIIHFRNRIWDDNEGINTTVNKTISKILLDGSKNIFIKMDIEGAEFKVLKNFNDLESKIIGLAIEFHDINSRANEFNRIIESLKKNFHIAHVHGNNYSKIDSISNFPSSLEITFINKKLMKGKVTITEERYPIKGLDQPNKHSKPDINLNFN